MAKENNLKMMAIKGLKIKMDLQKLDEEFKKNNEIVIEKTRRNRQISTEKTKMIKIMLEMF